MLRFAAVLVVLCLVGAYANDDAPAISPDIIQYVNNAQNKWVAGDNVYFGDWTIADVKRSMGVKKSTSFQQIPPKTYPAEVAAALPASFDARQQWPGCIGPVLNQGQCGSCWAFGAAEAASDRICLSKNGTFVQLAPLDLTTCDSNDGGCEGGDPGSAWNYIQQSGLVTESCYPYGTAEGGPITTCAPAQQPCLPPFQNTPSCVQQCHNNATWSSDKHFVSNVYYLSSVSDMQSDIYQNGPLEAAFSVYEDFIHYKSGVYTHTTGSLLGGHAIKIIGWGVENGVDYWLVQNSWTTTWGDGGYFKIARGTDECGIEDDAVAGSP